MNKFDYMGMCEEVKFDCEKAACLLEDVLNLFEAARPTDRTMQNIRLQYRAIALKLNMVYDYLSEIDDAANKAGNTEETHGATANVQQANS